MISKISNVIFMFFLFPSITDISTKIKLSHSDTVRHQMFLLHLEKVTKEIGIPLFLIETDGEDYEIQFENTLEILEKKGVKYCVFGDIDIKHHREWGEKRAENSNIKSLFPLWQENREKLVNEFISLGYKAIIKKVNLEKMGKDFLGETLTFELLEKIKATGSDVCGENGEYHTFVYDGPIFKNKIDIKKLEVRNDGILNLEEN